MSYFDIRVRDLSMIVRGRLCSVFVTISRLKFFIKRFNLNKIWPFWAHSCVQLTRLRSREKRLIFLWAARYFDYRILMDSINAFDLFQTKPRRFYHSRAKRAVEKSKIKRRISLCRNENAKRHICSTIPHGTKVWNALLTKVETRSFTQGWVNMDILNCI